MSCCLLFGHRHRLFLKDTETLQSYNPVIVIFRTVERVSSRSDEKVQPNLKRRYSNEKGALQTKKHPSAADV